MKISWKFIVLLWGVLMSSCASRKDMIYFQNNKINQNEVSNDYQLLFKPDDLVQIIVSSKDIVAAQPFNLPVIVGSPSITNAQGLPKLQSYLIDKEGYIEFPVLGKLKIGGLTRIEVIEMLKEKLSPDYLIDPVINIIITNFKVTVIGDVRSPRVLNFQNERVSIMDALGAVGDLNISGSRRNIMLLREEDGKKTKYYLDLTSNDIFTSPVYYLKQNDVIYVEQNNAKVQDAAYTRTTGLFISMASVLISLLTILTR